MAIHFPRASPPTSAGKQPRQKARRCWGFWLLSHFGHLSFDKLHQYGACIADDPDTCIAKLKEMKRRFGITEFVLWFNIGGIGKAHVERAMRLAAERVLPYV